MMTEYLELFFSCILLFGGFAGTVILSSYAFRLCVDFFLGIFFQDIPKIISLIAFGFYAYFFLVPYSVWVIDFIKDVYGFKGIL